MSTTIERQPVEHAAGEHDEQGLRLLGADVAVAVLPPGLRGRWTAAVARHQTPRLPRLARPVAQNAQRTGPDCADAGVDALHPLGGSPLAGLLHQLVRHQDHSACG